MGRPKVQQVETTQKQELDPIAQAYFWSGQLPEEKLASLRRINEQVYGYEPGTLTPVPTAASNAMPGWYSDSGFDSWVRLMSLNPNSNFYDPNARPFTVRGSPNGGSDNGVNSGSGSARTGGGGWPGGATGPMDYIDGGGLGKSGGPFEGGGRLSDIANAVTGQGPEAQKNKMATGGIVALANGGMVPPMMGGRMPNLSNRDIAYQMAMRAQGYAKGGYIEGPGTGTSDSIPAKIYQDGQPVQEAALSDGEFVMTKRAVDGAGGPARMYEMMRRFERGGRVN